MMTKMNSNSFILCFKKYILNKWFKELSLLYSSNNNMNNQIKEQEIMENEVPELALRSASETGPLCL